MTPRKSSSRPSGSWTGTGLAPSRSTIDCTDWKKSAPTRSILFMNARRAPLRHLDRHLVVRAADAAAAHLEHRRDRLHGLVEHLDRRLPGLLADAVERAVDDLLGDALLPMRHHAVDHLSDELGAVDRVGLDPARGDR